MSIFSEYLTELIDCRGLTAAKVAQICDVNKTSVSRWCNGSSLPQSWERLKTMISKMRLTQEEKLRLKNAYEYELLRAAHNESFHQILELCQALQRRRAEFQALLPALYAPNAFWNAVLFDFIKLDSKADILQCIWCELKKNQGSESGLCLKIHSFPQPLLALLKYFSNYTEKGELDILLKLEGSAAEKIGMIKNMVEILFTKEKVRLYVCSSESSCDEQNWILSDDFCIMFSDDILHGMLSRNAEWIAFFQREFRELKDMGSQIIVTHCEAFSYVMEMPYSCQEMQGRASVIEYMPCLSLGLTEQILNDNICLQSPQREKFIDEVMERFPRYALSGNLKLISFFTKEGLLEFMDTGRFDTFPYNIYKPVPMKERCEILENVLKTSDKMRNVCFICMKEEFLDMKGICIEQWHGMSGRITVEIHFGEDMNEQVQITDDDVKKEFEKFYEYLLVSDHVYNEEETRNLMVGVLEKYYE